jgi:hypothetical protein
MNFLINPPKNNIPSFIEKYYNKTVSDSYLTGLVQWASKEFTACVRHFAEKMDLKTWVNLRKLSPAYVLASLPNFITILKSISMEVWKRMDGKIIELFSDAYAIWKQRNGTMKSILAVA